jgi:quercetin dioxygenase-like cupin family protein
MPTVTASANSAIVGSRGRATQRLQSHAAVPAPQKLPQRRSRASFATAACSLPNSPVVSQVLDNSRGTDAFECPKGRDAPHSSAVTSRLDSAPVFEQGEGWLTVPIIEHRDVPFSVVMHVCRPGGRRDVSFVTSKQRDLRLVYILHGAACVNSTLNSKQDGYSDGFFLTAGDSALLVEGEALQSDGYCGDIVDEFSLSAIEVAVASAHAPLAAPKCGNMSGKPHPALGCAVVERLFASRSRQRQNAPDASAPYGRHKGNVRGLADADTFRLPGQSNRVALVWDPHRDEDCKVGFSFGIEILEPSHVTPRHMHSRGYEMFIILSGSGTAECDGEKWHIRAGDAVVFTPGSLHGIDVDCSGRMYCLQMMLPDDDFAQYVRSGDDTGGTLEAEDLCKLVSIACDMDSSPSHADTERSAR